MTVIVYVKMGKTGMHVCAITIYMEVYLTRLPPKAENLDASDQ